MENYIKRVQAMQLKPDNETIEKFLKLDERFPKKGEETDVPASFWNGVKRLLIKEAYKNGGIDMAIIEGESFCHFYDWIVKSNNGFYIVNDETFKKVYEKE